MVVPFFIATSQDNGRNTKRKEGEHMAKNGLEDVIVGETTTENQSAAVEKRVGRPKKYRSAKQLQKAIDDYFESCKGELAVLEDGTPVFDKRGAPVMIGVRPPTITGLALHLGFNSRQSLLNYQEEDEFLDTITRAKSRVEQYTEERLFDKDGANGAKFSLSNNFKGWAEKTEIDANVHRKLEELL